MTAEEYGREYGNGGLKRVAKILYSWERGRIAPAEAEEISQDAWVKGLQNLDQFDGRCKVTSWVTKIAMNQFIHDLRRMENHLDISDPNVLAIIPNSNRGSVLDEMAAEDLANRLLSICSPKKRTLLMMRFFDGLKIREISSITGVPTGTIKTDLHRTMSSLAKKAVKKDLIS